MTITDPVFRSCETYTQEEFARWVRTASPRDLHHYELLNGSIVREPPAGWPHGEIAALLLGHVAPFVRARGAGRVFDSSQGFELPSGDTVEPDVAFVSTARWTALSKPVRGYPRVVPDLAFEILSPSTRVLDETEKKSIYESNGVTEYVLVDPASRTVVQHQLARGWYGPAVIRGVGELYEGGVLRGLGIPVGDLFPEE